MKFNPDLFSSLHPRLSDQVPNQERYTDPSYSSGGVSLYNNIIGRYRDIQMKHFSFIGMLSYIVPIYFLFCDDSTQIDEHQKTEARYSISNQHFQNHFPHGTVNISCRFSATSETVCEHHKNRLLLISLHCQYNLDHRNTVDLSDLELDLIRKAVREINLLPIIAGLNSFQPMFSSEGQLLAAGRDSILQMQIESFFNRFHTSPRPVSGDRLGSKFVDNYTREYFDRMTRGGLI